VLILIAAVAGWSWQSGGIVAELTSPGTSATNRIAALKQFFDDSGPWAPALYVLFVTVEVVVAPIPGILLYAPGGLIFGPVWGGTLALIGNTAGAGISCALVRSVSGKFVARFTSGGSVVRIQTELERHGGWWIFLLRVNPLTSSDLVSYAAGVTRIRISTVMLATCFGMAPLCYAQSWLSDTLFSRFPWLISPLLALSVVYVVVVLVVLSRIVGATPDRAADHDDSDGSNIQHDS
jgi:uncharacterized membrane protein YdjX (TVP38/TMEM64 family)